MHNDLQQMETINKWQQTEWISYFFDKKPDICTVHDFYRAMHLSAYARSWDHMSSVCLSVCLSVRLWRWWFVIT